MFRRPDVAGHPANADLIFAFNDMISCIHYQPDRTVFLPAPSICAAVRGLMTGRIPAVLIPVAASIYFFCRVIGTSPLTPVFDDGQSQNAFRGQFRVVEQYFKYADVRHTSQPSTVTLCSATPPPCP